MNNETRYCAFCGHQRRIYQKTHVGVVDVLGALGMALLIFALLGDRFDPRSFGLAAIFIGIAEIFTLVRHRISLRCGRCGFDPIVYRRSQDDAAKMVKAYIERRKEDPALLLAGPVRPYGERLKGKAKKDRIHRDLGSHQAPNA